MRWNFLLIVVLLSMLALLLGSCNEKTDSGSGMARPGGKTSQSQSADDVLGDE